MKQSWFEKSIRVGLFAGLLLAGLLANAQLQTEPERPTPGIGRPGNFIVTFQPGTSQADRAVSARRAGATLRFNYGIVEAIAISGADVNVLAALQRDVSVLEIIPDRPVQAFAEDTPQTTPQGVTRIGAAPTAGSLDGTGIGVAIVDTGIDLSHADLAGGVSSQFFTAFGSSCQDDHSHGTHVSGIVAARDNDIDVVGVAPASTLYCVKVLDKNGSGSDATVIAGLDWVFQNRNLTPRIRVVNMSLGRNGSLNDDPAYRSAIQALYNTGIATVVAAGNDPSKEVKQMVPATYPEVMAVASTTAKVGANAGCPSFTSNIAADTASFFTTDGKFDKKRRIGVTISAPGEDQEDVTADCFAASVGILSLKLGGGTTRMSGTSMASPHVAGIVARLMQTSPGLDLSNLEIIRSWIRDNALLKGVAPLNSPTRGYTYDREREGISKAP